MRLFKKSKYEKTFKDNFVLNYRGYDIYEYDSIVKGRIRYTFWYSSNSEDYYSSLVTIEECKELIDRIIK